MYIDPADDLNVRNDTYLSGENECRGRTRRVREGNYEGKYDEISARESMRGFRARFFFFFHFGIVTSSVSSRFSLEAKRCGACISDVDSSKNRGPSRDPRGKVRFLDAGMHQRCRLGAVPLAAAVFLGRKTFTIAFTT